MTTARIYLDNAATTPLDPRVLEAMLPYFRDRYGNPSSRTHAFGWEAEEAVEMARREVAELVGVDSREVVFTSGATEANNLAIRGVAEAAGPGAHFVTTEIEHEAVLEPMRSLERRGHPVTWVRPDTDGLIDPDRIAAALRANTVLVSMIHGNNEVGSLQDLGAIAAACAERGVILHSDATQSVGKVALDLRTVAVQLVSASAHKIHGPKGVGCLVVRRGERRVRLGSQIEGGGQERGLRSGTLNVPGIVGFGRACALARESMAAESTAIADLRGRLETSLLEKVEGAARNGPASRRLPGITNLHFEGIEAEALMLRLPRIAVSLGSACASASLTPSHVLRAMGRSETVARNSIRFSLGRFTTVEEINMVIEEVARVAGEMRRDPERIRAIDARKGLERRNGC